MQIAPEPAAFGETSNAPIPEQLSMEGGLAPIPAQVSMEGGGDNFPALSGPNLFVKQTKRGCFQELIGCEAKSEFLISTMENRQNFFLYALEDTSCMNRFCLGGYRPWEINVTQGVQPGGAPVAKYERP